MGLIGIQRVDPLAMDLTLCNERRAHLVLTAGRRPTKELLEKLCELMPKMLEGCENLHVSFKHIKNQKEKWTEREREELLANEEWEYVSDDTEEEEEEDKDEVAAMNFAEDEAPEEPAAPVKDEETLRAEAMQSMSNIFGEGENKEEEK